MKTNNKRILSIILALVMILSMLPMVALAATPSKLYLKPNSNWTSAGARFAAYFFGNGEKWVSMTDTDNDGYYEVDVPSGYPKVIFCRMNGSTSANNWNNKWNQTGDLTIPTSGNNCFTVPSGSWDGATTQWSTYTPVVVPVWESPIVNGDSVTFNYWSPDALSSVDVRGTINNWTESAEHHMTKDATTGIWSVTVSGLYNGQYEYKFVTNGTNWINDPKNTGAQVGGNNTFIITEGKVDINEPEYTSPVIEGGSVTFNYWRAQEFTSATVYGDMSKDGWATAYPMVKNEETGVWSVTISDLYNGTYEYKIVVDEAWLVDPKNDLIADNGNSMFTITESIDEPELPPDILTTPSTLYLLPNFNWNSDYAAFAAYFYNTDGENTWVSMTDSNGDGVYEAAVPEGMTSLIFCRMDPAAAEPSWDSKWNQSDDITIPTDGTDLFVMSQDTWGKDTENPWAGAWETYTEIPVPEFKSPVIDGNSVTFNYWHYGATSVSVRGSMDSWGEGYAMVKDENGLWSVTINDLADALYQYKFVVDDVWILDPANWETYDEYDDEGNIKNQNSKFILGTPVAEIYNVGEYFTFESAYAAADPDNGDSIVLLSDLTVNDLAVDKEMYLDLNGHDLTINAASATATIFAQDSATNDPNATEWGKLIVNGAEFTSLGGYVMLPEDDGYAFHSYSIEITHISLQPGKDALGYKAVLESNSRVLAAVTEIGFEFSVNGGTPVTVTKAVTNANAEFTARLKNIMACGGGEMEITASAFMVVADEALWSNSETTSMKDTIQTVNTMELGDAQKTAVYGLYSQYASVMDAWLGESNNIKSWAPAE